MPKKLIQPGRKILQKKTTELQSDDEERNFEPETEDAEVADSSEFVSDSELYNTDEESDSGQGRRTQDLTQEFEEFFGDNDVEQAESSDEGKSPKKSERVSGFHQKSKKRVHFDNEIGEESGSSSTIEEEVHIKKRKKGRKVDANANLEPLAVGKPVPDWQSMSSLERRQFRLQKQIAELEAQNLSERPWQMRGEIEAGRRPENSLIEAGEEVQAETAVRPPPEITADVTEKLETIIKRRIKDKAWDDVERKEKPIMKQTAYSNTLVLDQTKSKDSLAAVYEQEYTKQLESAIATKSLQNSNSLGVLSEERKFTKPEHADIAKQLKDLFSKLDALTNFHYNPLPPLPEPVITKKNFPSIAMEEPVPVAVSADTMLAPEEVKEPVNLKTITQEENASTKRKKRKDAAKKFGVRKEKLKAKEQKKELKQAKRGQGTKSGLASSAKFFETLQNQVQKEIAGKGLSKAEKITARKGIKNSAAYKL